MRNNRLLRFAAILGATDLFSALVAVYALGYSWASPEWMWALLAADINAIAGYFFLMRKTGASMNELYSTVVAGMFFRMAGLAGVLWLALVQAGFSKIGFTITLLIAYICKSVAEMVFIKLDSRK